MPGGASPERRTGSLRGRFARATRWLHVYLSMLGLAVVLFFSVTGITLNHPDWFGLDGQASTTYEGQVNVAWIDGEAPGIDPSYEGDPAVAVDKLQVVEYLRNTHGIRGALASFTADEYECVVSFKGPGYSADAFIDRSSGDYQLTETALGWVAVVNDLHKGRDTGPVWSVVIDISAFLTAMASVSGLILLFYMNRRWTLAMVTALAGTAAAVLAFVLGVP